MQSKQLGIERLICLSITDLCVMRDEVAIELERIEAAIVLRSIEDDAKGLRLFEEVAA